MRMMMIAVMIFLLAACSASSVDTVPSNLGRAATMQELSQSMQRPGPIRFKKIAVANWQVPLSGLLNLEHQKAQQAGLEDKAESIQIYLYILQHPEFGTYLVDSGVSENFELPVNEDVSFLVRKAMNIAALDVLKTTSSVLESFSEINGVFLTHLHLDHVMGMQDVDGDVPVYTGPGEAASELVMHAATRGSIDRMLQNVDQLAEWRFGEEGVIDVFGDGSLWAIHVPGHTPGSTAFLARTPTGAELMVGDATHTRWGWDNQVEPGSYSKDQPLSAKSLNKLAVMVERHPTINVHPGHQH